MSGETAERSARPRTRPAVLGLVLGFAISRLVLFRLGVHLSADDLPKLWQVLDLDLLRHDLARSLLYCHAQPPLFNLYVGLGLKAAGAAAAGLFQVAQILAGGTITVSIFLAARALDVPDGLGLLVASVFALSPGAIGFENCLFYPILEAALLVTAAPFLHRYLRDGRGRDAGAGFGLLGAMVLLRSYFHVAWLLAVVALVLALRRPSWRRTVAAAAPALLVCVLWYGKNAWLFGSFTSSTWLGMNLSRITLQTLPHHDRGRLVREGVLSELARLDSFGPLSRYEEVMTLPPPTGIPVLDRPRKGRGESNFNHLAYIEISRRYFRDAIALVRARPGVYLTGVSFAIEHYVRPVSDLTEIARILRPLGPYRDLAEIGMYGRIWLRGSPAGHCLFVMVGLPGLFLFGVVVLVRELRQDGPDLARAGLLAYILFDLAYVTVLGNALDRGENQRFRFAIEPLVAVLLALFADRIRRRLF